MDLVQFQELFENLFIKEKEMTDIQENAFIVGNENLEGRFTENELDEIDEMVATTENTSSSLVDFDEDYDYDENGYCFFTEEKKTSVKRHGFIWDVIGFTETRTYILKDPKTGWVIFVDNYNIDEEPIFEPSNTENGYRIFEL